MMMKCAMITMNLLGIERYALNDLNIIGGGPIWYIHGRVGSYIPTGSWSSPASRKGLCGCITDQDVILLFILSPVIWSMLGRRHVENREIHEQQFLVFRHAESETTVKDDAFVKVSI